MVYLETSLAQQLQRVGKGRGRPLLKDVDLPARLAELRAVRDPLYREIADVTLSTDNRRVARVANLVLDELGIKPIEPRRRLSVPGGARSILHRLC